MTLKNSNMPPQAHGRPDDFQTPPTALGPLYRFLDPAWTIWECAAGERNITNALQDHGYKVISTDVVDGYDFLNYATHSFDAIVTNPPFSIKDKFIARCYELGKPWAMLLPVNALGGQRRQKMYRKHGLQILMLGRRVMFKTPVKQKYLRAWQEHAWFTWGLSFPQDIMFERIE